MSGDVERELAERMMALRRTASPASSLGRDEPYIASTSLKFDPERLIIEVSIYEDRWSCHRLQLPASADVESEHFTSGCSCGSSFEECAFAPHAIDAVLEALLASPRNEQLKELLDELRSPPWKRALRAFDRARAVPAMEAGAGGARMVWKIVTAEPGCWVVPLIERAGKNGRFQKPRALKLDERDALAGVELAAGDREALAFIEQELEALRELGEKSRRRSMPCSKATSHRAIAELAGHPRVLIADAPKDDGVPISVSKHALSVAAVVGEDSSTRIEVRLDGTTPLSPSALGLLQAEARGRIAVVIDRDAGDARVIELPENAEAVFALASAKAARFPLEARLELLSRLPEIQRHLSVETDPKLAIHRVTASSALVVRIEPRHGDAAIRVTLLVRPSAETGVFAPGQGPSSIYCLDRRGERPLSVERSLDAERACAAALIEAVPAFATARPVAAFVFDLQGDPALELVRALESRRGELEVEWPAAKLRISGTATAKHLALAVVDRRDWFDIDGAARVADHELELAALLEAARDNRKFVRLDDESWIELDRSLLIQLGRIADVAEETSSARAPGAVQLGPMAPFLLADLGDELAGIEASARWRDAVERLARARELDVEPPAALAGELRPYQRDGYRWLARLAEWGLGACLADDMGLGKTVQTLALLIRRAELGPALVAAPTSVAFNWVREMERFAPSLRPILLREVHAGERSTALASLGPGDVAIIGYGLLARELESLEKIRFSTFVIDEAQAIKNAETDRARAAQRIQASFRIALTGTPVENHALDLWSIFRAVCPGLLGGREHFQRRFAAQRRSALAGMVRPFILRRTKSEVLADLPPKMEIRVDVELSPEERRRYEQARLAAVAHLTGAAGEQTDAQRRFYVLAALTRLRQLACDPRLVDSEREVPSAKITTALSLLLDLRAEGHRALVFSQFTSLLALLRRALDGAGLSYVYLDGSTPAAERERVVDEFQSGAATAFLLSLKAGGSGLNLTAADYVLHLDPWWNPAVEDQATDRAHRIGQSRAVTVYRLVARGTIEESMLALHAEKRELFDDILDGTNSAGRMSTEELLALIRG